MEGDWQTDGSSVDIRNFSHFQCHFLLLLIVWICSFFFSGVAFLEPCYVNTRWLKAKFVVASSTEGVAADSLKRRPCYWERHVKVNNFLLCSTSLLKCIYKHIFLAENLLLCAGDVSAHPPHKRNHLASVGIELALLFSLGNPHYHWPVISCLHCDPFWLFIGLSLAWGGGPGLP